MSRKKGSKNLDKQMIDKIEKLSKTHTAKQIAEELKIDVQSVYRHTKNKETKPKKIKNLRVWFLKEIFKYTQEKNYDKLTSEQVVIILKIDDLINSFWQASTKKKN